MELLSSALIVFVVASLAPWITEKLMERVGKTFAISQDEASNIEAVLNDYDRKTIARIWLAGTIVTIALLAPLFALLLIPIILEPGVLFSSWDEFVLRDQSFFLWALVLPALICAAIASKLLAVKVVRLVFKVFNPRLDARFIDYFGDAMKVTSEGYRVVLDPFALNRAFLFWSMTIYLTFLVFFYFTVDIITQTNYQQRSILPFLNNPIPHEELVYESYDEGLALRITRAVDGTVVNHIPFAGTSVENAERQMEKIRGVAAITLGTYDEN